MPSRRWALLSPGADRLQGVSAMLGKLFSGKDNIDIIEMEPQHCAAAALLHAERFSRPWTDGEFHALLAQKPVIGFVARQTGLFAARPIVGFVLAREVAGEAEILSVGVGSKFERLGIGWRLMQAAIRVIGQRGGETVFLEVDEGNAAAIALYRRLRFQKVAERKGYYSDERGHKSTALVMRLDLG